jgi:hypothetical protein
MKRGMEVCEASRITEQADGSFSVPSQTHHYVIYEVRLFQTVWVCTCPDFEYRKIECCKHIYAVKFWIATNTYLQNNNPKPKVLADDAIAEDAVLLELSTMVRVLQVSRLSFAKIATIGLFKTRY